MYFSIASIDFQAPYVLSGSSDRHLRLYDVTNMQGWSTSPEQNDTVANPPISQASQVLPQNPVVVCNSCGSPNPQSNGTDGSQETATIVPQPHEDLVRSVALGDEVVVSGSYDMTVKVMLLSSLLCCLTNFWKCIRFGIGRQEQC